MAALCDYAAPVLQQSYAQCAAVALGLQLWRDRCRLCNRQQRLA